MDNDLISRQAAIDTAEMLFKDLRKDEVDMMGIGYNHAVSDNITILKNLPSAEPKRKKGTWIKMSDADGVYWACSECGENIPRVSDYDPQFNLFPRLKSIKKTNFCANCGADMRQDDPSHPFADSVMMKGETDE